MPILFSDATDIIRAILPTPLHLIAAAVIALALVVLFVVLGPLPYKIARSRRHPEAVAIGITNLSALYFLPCWLIALVWALSHHGSSTAAPTTPPPLKDDKSTSTRHADEAQHAARPSQTAAMWSADTNDSNSTAGARSLHSPPADPGPGGYLIVGINAHTHQDVELIIDARSLANAKVKAELQGIKVTSCTLQYALS